MNLDDLPIVGTLLEAGTEDQVFDALLLAGPITILIVAVVGRGPVTIGLAVGYVMFFVAYVLYRGVRY